MKDTYTPKHNGVEGLEAFGDVRHGLDYSFLSEVRLDGKKLVGRCTEPHAVVEFLIKNKVPATARVERVYCSPTNPNAARAERRQGWKFEENFGLPDAMRCRAAIAEGALRFYPGWDANGHAGANAGDWVIYDSETGAYSEGAQGSGTTSRVDPFPGDE